MQSCVSVSVSKAICSANYRLSDSTSLVHKMLQRSNTDKKKKTGTSCVKPCGVLRLPLTVIWIMN